MAGPMQVLSRKSGSAAQASGDASRPSKRRSAQEGDKVVVRRLPPAMTEDEFFTILGDAWKLGQGKVTWVSYKPGKVSQHPSIPSRPSRAYLFVVKKDDLLALSQAVQTSTWEDAKGSHNDPTVELPPIAELCPYKKIPSDKKRTDSRQGTIDQDPEFMSFLENLACPDAQKDGEGDSPEDDALKPEKTTTTPLIEYLREKKAAKVKEVAAARSARHSRQDSQGAKGEPAPSGPESSKRKGKETRDSKPEKPRESVKILTKKAAADKAVEVAKAVASQIQSSASSSTQAQEPLPKSRRAGIAAAARILQRDLGLSPGNAHRKARQEAAKAEAETKGTSSKEPAKESPPAPKEAPAAPPAPAERPASPAPAKASSLARTRTRKRGGGDDSSKAKGETKGEKAPEPAPQAQPPTKGPIVLMKKKDKEPVTPPVASSSTQPAVSTSENAAKATPQPVAKSTPTPPPGSESKSTPPKQNAGSKRGGGKADATPSPSSGATRAFIKRANPSQGVTDSTLREAMQAFGAVTGIEMDRKKGFAYVDFTDHASLVKAMAASPVTVAQGSVQVVERKDMSKKPQGGGGKAPAAASSSKDVGGGGGKAPAVTPSSKDVTAATEASGSGSQPAQTSTAASGSNAPAGASTNPTPAEKTGGERRGGRRRGGRGKDKESSASATKDSTGGGKNAGGAGDGGGGSGARQGSK